MLRALFVACAATTALIATTSLGRAQVSTDRTLAQSLFEQGRQLMQAKNYGAACPKLAESERLDPSPGTLLNLAVCHERAGKLATAWGEFGDAATAARRANEPERAAFADEHAHELAPRLAHVTIEVGGEATGLAIALDGVDIGRPAWGTPLPVDVGAHQVVATRGGQQVWATTIQIQRDGESQSVTVPADANGAASPAATTSSSAEQAGAPITAPTEALPSRVLPLTAFSVGVVGLGVGIGAGLAGASKHSTLQNECNSNNVCSPGAQGDLDSFHSLRTISTVGYVVGALGLAGGVTLWLLAPASSSRASVTLSVVPTSATIVGAF